MASMNMMEFIQEYAIVNLRVTTWTGRRNNSAKDLGLENAKISRDVASLGGKSVYDKEKLKFQTRLRREAEVKLNELGFPCMGGWAVKKGLVPDIQASLNSIQAEYLNARDQMLATYETECALWVDSVEQKVDIEQLSEAVRNSLYSKEYIQKQISFSYEINADLMTNPVGDSAVMTIADMAEESLRAFEYSMDNKKASRGFNRRCLSYLTKLKVKLSELALVDSFVEPVIETIEKFESQWPAPGSTISAANISELCGILALLSKPSYLSSLRQSDLMVVEDDPEDQLTQLLASTKPGPTHSLFDLNDDEFDKLLESMASSGN